MFKVETLAVGPLQANCHILYDQQTGEAMVIDPGDEGPRIVDHVNKMGLKPLMILNTHGHVDHIGANGWLKEHWGIPLAIHQGEAELLCNATANMSSYLGVEITSPPADILFKDGDAFPIGSDQLCVLDVSGHSPAGSAFHIQKLVFTGDALFKQGVGRTDFPGGSHEKLIRNIRKNLLSLSDDTVVCPGHGPKTTIGDEKYNNPYLLVT